jgi:hypothetical protein
MVTVFYLYEGSSLYMPLEKWSGLTIPLGSKYPGR